LFVEALTDLFAHVGVHELSWHQETRRELICLDLLTLGCETRARVAQIHPCPDDMIDNNGAPLMQNKVAEFVSNRKSLPCSCVSLVDGYYGSLGMPIEDARHLSI